MKRALVHLVFWLVPSLLASLLGVPQASASKPRCRLERVDPTGLGHGELKLYANLLELEGDVDAGLAASAFTLLINNKGKGKAEKAQPFSAVRESVDIALVVEVAAQFKPALENVKTALRNFLEEQPPSMKISLITFGSEIESPTPFLPAPAMSQRIDDLTAEDDSGDVRMTDAVRAAINHLNKLGRPAPTKGGDEPANRMPPRRLIVLVSDGLNARMDRQTFKKVGEDAAAARIPIHSIAFSPIDSRGPLLNLGDLSKRSNGTFRWAQKADDLKAQLDTLADEVRKQYVLTFKTDVKDPDKKLFGLICREVRSNQLTGTGGVPVVEPPSGFWRWLPWGLGGLALLLALLYVIGLLMKAREARAGGRVMPGQPIPASANAGGMPMQPMQRPIQQQPMQQQGWHAGAAGGAATGGRGTLVAIGGALSGSRLAVQGRITVGKSPGHSVTVADDPSVSSNHCEIRQEMGGFVVYDLGSTNGTFVNSRRLTGPQRLGDGDILRLGENTQFKFRID